MGLFGRMLGRGRNGGDPPDFRRLVEKALNHLGTLTAAHEETWQLGKADWNVDQDAGTIIFTSEGLQATAPVQLVGTYDTEDGTWLWGRDNPTIDAALMEHSRRMLDYGRTHAIADLTTPSFACSEERCWELTAVTCLLCEAQGAYRGPAGTTMVFMTFGEVTLSKTS